MKSIVEYVNESTNSSSIYAALKTSNIVVVNDKFGQELFFNLTEATIKLDAWGLNGWKAEDKGLSINKVKTIVDAYASAPNAVYFTEAEKLKPKFVNELLSLVERYKNVYVIFVTTDTNFLDQHEQLSGIAELVK